MKLALQKLLVLALILAWFSPACATRAGAYTVMEICGAFGMKSIAVPAEQAPQEPHKKAAHECPFCFANSHNLGLKSAGIFTAPLTAPAEPFREGLARAASCASASPFPRGPPLSFV